MRDRILESLDQISGYLDFDLQCQISGKEYAADELTALMCYREARAIIEWIGIDYLMEYEESVVDQLGKTYDSDMVWNAIEQVKNEMK